MRSFGIVRPLVLVLAAAVLLGGPAFSEEAAATYEVSDPDGIYYGDGEHPKAPAVITADDVWAEIPEYKKIIDDELDDDDPEYHLLLKKATERFAKALKRTAKRDGYDMIGEVGSIVVKGDKKAKIADVTDEMIGFVTRN